MAISSRPLRGIGWKNRCAASETVDDFPSHGMLATAQTYLPLQVEEGADIVACFSKTDSAGDAGPKEFSIPPRPHHILQDVSAHLCCRLVMPAQSHS